MTRIDYGLNSYKTALKRKKPSNSCVKFFEKFKGNRVLDYGCGFGSDTQFLRREGVDCTGFDPYILGFKAAPVGKFDVVFLNNVVSTLPDPTNVLRAAWAYVKVGGSMIIVARNESEVVQTLRKVDWVPHGKGWVTNWETYVQGHTPSTLTNLMLDSGIGNFRIEDVGQTSYCHLIIKKVKKDE